MSGAPDSAAGKPISCPHCGNDAPFLVKVDAGMRLRLEEQGQSAPEEVCPSCKVDLSRSVSQGAKLRAEAQVKEQNRLMMWRNRVNLIKQARQLMSTKQYSDAALSYEKYLRVLEIVHGKSPGELTPEIFKNEARKQELTVIASVYWDLLRIYDTSNRYGDRAMKTAEKLAEFARHTPVFPNIVRKAESHMKQARNPYVFKQFLKMCNAKTGRCFIATAAFEGPRHPTVIDLCLFRDQYLRKRRWGRKVICVYYQVSPTIADFLDRHPGLKPAVRQILRQLATRLVVRFNLKHRTEL